MKLLVNEVVMDRQFHPPIAGNNRYRYVLPQPFDKPIIVVPIAIVQGARDVWRSIFRIVAKDNSSLSRASRSRRRAPSAWRNIPICGASCRCLSMLCVKNFEKGSLNHKAAIAVSAGSM